MTSDLRVVPFFFFFYSSAFCKESLQCLCLCSAGSFSLFLLKGEPFRFPARVLRCEIYGFTVVCGEALIARRTAAHALADALIDGFFAEGVSTLYEHARLLQLLIDGAIHLSKGRGRSSFTNKEVRWSFFGTKRGFLTRAPTTLDLN